MNEQQRKVTTGNQDSTSFSTPWKIRAKFFHSVEKRGFAVRGSTVRRPQDVDAGDFVRNWTGSSAKISSGFSDDAALRMTRAGLVSASGRPQSGSAEKTRLVFAPANSERNPRPSPSPAAA